MVRQYKIDCLNPDEMNINCCRAAWSITSLGWRSKPERAPRIVGIPKPGISPRLSSIAHSRLSRAGYLHTHADAVAGSV